MNEIRRTYLHEPEITCANDTQIELARTQVKVLIGIMHESFDPWEYNQDGGLQYVLEWTNVEGLHAQWQQIQTQQVQRRTTLFRDSWIYNYPVHQVGIHLATYLLSPPIPTQYSLNLTDITQSEFKWTFQQHPIYVKNGCTRQALATFIAIMGGFTAAIIRVTNLFLNNYQGFVLTKSMVKKLYTRKETSGNSGPDSRMNQFGDKTS
jgi:hypothetical protein